MNFMYYQYLMACENNECSCENFKITELFQSACFLVKNLVSHRSIVRSAKKQASLKPIFHSFFHGPHCQ